MIDEDTERSKGYEWMVLSVSEGFLAWRARWPTVPFLIIQSERSEVREEDWRPSHSYHYPPNRWAWVRSSPHASSSTVTKESEMEWQRSDITFPNQIFYYHIRRAATDERSEEEPEPVMWTPRKRGYEWPSAAHITHYHFINSLFLSLGVGRHYQSHVIYLVCRWNWRPTPLHYVHWWWCSEWSGWSGMTMTVQPLSPSVSLIVLPLHPVTEEISMGDIRDFKVIIIPVTMWYYIW